MHSQDTPTEDLFNDPAVRAASCEIAEKYISDPRTALVAIQAACIVTASLAASAAIPSAELERMLAEFAGNARYLLAEMQAAGIFENMENSQ